MKTAPPLAEISGFREAIAKIFEGPPGEKPSGECVYLSWCESPLGPLVTGASRDGICFLEFSDPARLAAQWQALQKRLQSTVIPGENQWTQQLHLELRQYFAGELRGFTVPVPYAGSPFQERVWSQLLKVPYGETCNYEAVARAIGSPGAVRAVGRANGENRIAIVIPCHRVVNKNGELGGYGGGVWRKKFLLKLEQDVQPRTQENMHAQPLLILAARI